MGRRIDLEIGIGIIGGGYMGKVYVVVMVLVGVVFNIKLCLCFEMVCVFLFDFVECYCVVYGFVCVMDDWCILVEDLWVEVVVIVFF